MNKREAIEDAKTLRLHAAGLTYNDSQAEAVAKHRLHEIAMRIETGFYGKTLQADATLFGYVPIGLVESAISGAGGFHVRLNPGAVMPKAGVAIAAVQQKVEVETQWVSCRCFDEASRRLCADKNRCFRVDAFAAAAPKGAKP